MTMPSQGDRVALLQRTIEMLTGEVQRAVAERDEALGAKRVAVQLGDDLVQENKALRVLLREVEWSQDTPGGSWHCWFCGGVQEVNEEYLEWAATNDAPRVPGHSEDCRLKVALEAQP